MGLLKPVISSIVAKIGKALAKYVIGLTGFITFNAQLGDMALDVSQIEAIAIAASLMGVEFLIDILKSKSKWIAKLL